MTAVSSPGGGGDGAAVAVVIGAGAVTAFWAGAQLAGVLFGAGPLPIGLGDTIAALTRLPANAANPAHAWPPAAQGQLPGAVPYWLCTLFVVVAAVTLTTMVVRLVAYPMTGSRRRRRLGVDTRARLANARDMRPLGVRHPIAGRMILGRVRGRLVATEDRHGAPTRRSQHRQGDRSAVAVIGPTRCGKTANIISGILEWDGPAILSSVKTDLLAHTVAHRAQIGEVRIFDPTGDTGYPSSSWSPLRAADTLSGAQRAARALSDAAPRDGVENAAFFAAMGRQLLWPMLYTAAIRGRTMGELVHWVLTQDRPIDDVTPGTVFAILDEELVNTDQTRRHAAAKALDALTAIWDLDERTRGGTYATAQTMIEPWQDPDVAAVAESCDIDLDWLLSGNNTLYICGPADEQERLAVVFGGLLGDLKQQAYRRANLTNQPLPSTLLVMDEAGNTPTRWLPSVASTCSGIGILLVTVWQSKAQIDAAYGRQADSVLTNHGTKIVFSGVSDDATLQYATRLLGDEEVAQLSLTADVVGARRTINDSTTRIPLVPSDILRQVRPGEALLLHGTLRPAHLISRPYWKERHLDSLSHGRSHAVVRPARFGIVVPDLTPDRDPEDANQAWDHVTKERPDEHASP